MLPASRERVKLLLQVPDDASDQLKTTIETIDFLMALPRGSQCEIGQEGDPTVLYRTTENTIIVQYYGPDESFVKRITEAVHSAGLRSLMVSAAGVHFFIDS